MGIQDTLVSSVPIDPPVTRLLRANWPSKLGRWQIYLFYHALAIVFKRRRLFLRFVTVHTYPLASRMLFSGLQICEASACRFCLLVASIAGFLPLMLPARLYSSGACSAAKGKHM